MANVVRVAKPGFDVRTETDPDKLVFSSEYNTLKYYVAGNVNVNWVDDGNVYSTTLAHNLGYVPFFVVYVQEGGGSLYNTVPNNNTTLAGEDYIDAYADSTNLYFKIKKNQATAHTGTATFYYKIFKNNLGF